jgi:hypothetical protein
MSLPGILLQSSLPQSDNGPSIFKKGNDDFQQLRHFLLSGDLNAASSALKHLEQDVPIPSSFPGTQIKDDVSALRLALSSGSLIKAREAYTTLQRDFRGAFDTPPTGDTTGSHDPSLHSSSAPATNSGTGPPRTTVGDSQSKKTHSLHLLASGVLSLLA